MRRWRKAFLVLAAVIALVAALVVDERLKTAPGAGFCPSDVAWRISFADFPRFWHALDSSGPFRALAQEWPSPLREMEVAVRKSTGVRPTNARWRLWMGPFLLAAGNGGSAVFCVRPGLLLRAAHALRPLLSIERDGNVFRYNDVWYAWQEGYLIFSTNQDGVENALTTAILSPSEVSGRDEAQIEWLSEPRLSMKFVAGDTWHVEGTVERSMTRHEGSLAVHNTWGNSPMLAITARNMPEALGLLAPLTDRLATLPDWTGVPNAFNRIGSVLQPNRIKAAPCSIAIYGINRDVVPPVLEWGALTARPTAETAPTPAVSPQSESLASRPVLNEGFDFTAEPPNLLDGILDESRISERLDAGIAIVIDWRKLSDAIEKSLRAGNEKGAFESLPKDQLERYWIPMARGFGGLLELRLDANGEGDRTSFSGYVATAK